MRYAVLWMTALFVAAAAPAAGAQDSGPARPRAEELRRRIRERFADRIREDLKLNEDQMQRLRATVATFAGRRRDMERAQADLRSALSGQLQPGVAAKPDSVARLTDELVDLRVRYAESFREEQAELSRYLDPVQRARLTLLRDRLVDRAREFRGRRLQRRMDR
jgi:hypothetical protein